MQSEEDEFYSAFKKVQHHPDVNWDWAAGRRHGGGTGTRVRFYHGIVCALPLVSSGWEQTTWYTCQRRDSRNAITIQTIDNKRCKLLSPSAKWVTLEKQNKINKSYDLDVNWLETLVETNQKKATCDNQINYARRYCQKQCRELSPALKWRFTLTCHRENGHCD